jgi:hypothetical protein
MPIDLERKIAFVHVPRTGGRSIEKLLRLDTAERFFSSTPLPALKPADQTPQHFTLRELEQNVGATLLQGCFRFAFVRNPWDRFFSEYVWRRSWRFKPPHAELDYFYHPRDLESLDAFVRVLDLPEAQRLVARRGFDAHLEPQRSFLLDRAGKVAMDFVGRFERFEADVRRVGDRLGIRIGKIPRVGKRGRDADYRRHYSAYSRDAVAAVYAEDVREFGYAF